MRSLDGGSLHDFTRRPKNRYPRFGHWDRSLSRVPGRIECTNRAQIPLRTPQNRLGAVECPAELKSRTVHLADPDPYLGCPGDSENDEMRVRQLSSRSTTSETHRDVSSAAAMVNLPIPHPAATTPTAAETTLVHSQINQQNSTREQEWYDSYNSPADERFKARN